MASTLLVMQDPPPPKQDDGTKPHDPPPSFFDVTVPIELVQLQLVSVNPLPLRGCQDKKTDEGVTGHSPCYANSERKTMGRGKSSESSAGYIAELDWEARVSRECFFTCTAQLCESDTQTCWNVGRAATNKKFAYEDCALGWTGSPFKGGKPIMGWRVKVTSPPILCRCRCR
jgi:hypothetical protein